MIFSFCCRLLFHIIHHDKAQQYNNGMKHDIVWLGRTIDRMFHQNMIGW